MAGRRWPDWVVGALAAAAGLWAVAVSRIVLPYTSRNPDEAVYLLQADTFRHGHLFPPAPAKHVASLQPFFHSYRHGHYVPKYPPVHAALLAFGRVVFGTYRAGLAIIAIALVIATYLLAVEVLSDRRQAVLATAMLTLSPVVLIQSATFLAYLEELVLLELFAWTFLVGRRTQQHAWFVAAGLLAGTAYFARPLDAVLFGLPFAVWLFVAHRRWIVPLVLGALPPLVTFALYNHAATGRFLHTPFALDPSDTLGFGRHRMTSYQPYFDYTPGAALAATARHVGYLSFWLFGGAVTIAVAVAFLVITRKASARVLGGVLLSVPVGYFFFWGISVATTARFSQGIRYFGPWYYAGTFAPLAVLAAGGYSLVLRRRPRIGVPLLGALLVGSVAVTGWAIGEHHGEIAPQRKFIAVAERAPAGSLLFLREERVMLLYKLQRNPTLDGRVVYARDLGPAVNSAVAREFPRRKPMYIELDVNGDPSLQPLTFVGGTEVTVQLELPAGHAGETLLVESNRWRADCRITAARPVQVTVTATAASCSKGAEQLTTGKSPAPGGQLWITLASPDAKAVLYRWQAMVAVAGDRVVISPPSRPQIDATAGAVHFDVSGR